MGSIVMLQWVDSSMVSVNKHDDHLEKTQMVCLLSAQNELILSYFSCKMKQKLHIISFYVDIDNAKSSKILKMK